MKKNLYIAIISILLIQYANAQNYIPLAVEGAHWVIRFDKIETFERVDGLWEYFASGDTVIDSLTYKKIFKRDLVITQGGPPFQPDGPYQLHGLIRDDSTIKKVYALRFYNINHGCPMNEEYLLFDFSLNVGDTVDLCGLPDFWDYVVQNIYFSEVLGFSTRVYVLDPDIYEGMGSSYGLFEYMFAPFKKNGKRYTSSTFLEYYCRESPCMLFVSNNESVESPSIIISPTPAKDILYISSSAMNEITLITIYSNIGKKEIQVTRDFNKINVSKLEHGLYIIELIIDKKIVRQKILIN